MRVAVTQTEDARLGSSTRLDLHPGPPEDRLLSHRVHLGLGVSVDIELTAVCCWRALIFPTRSRSARAFVDALIEVPAGEASVPTDRAVAGRAALISRTAHPLLRVAVVDALDRWLHLPLDQSLLDAERGVSRLALANCLPDGPARCHVVGEALASARKASSGVTAYLNGLGWSTRVSPPLFAALGGLVRGYTELDDELDEGESDAELSAVVAGWRRLVRRQGKAEERPGRTAIPGAPLAIASLDGPGHSVIDPRQSWARTFALDTDPDAAEVRLHTSDDGGTLTVRVPVFEASRLTDLLARVVVRLRDRGTGGRQVEALLSAGVPRVDGSVALEASVPRDDLDPAHLVLDLVDVQVARTSAIDGDPATVRRVRRAVTTLATWRSAVALLASPGRPDERAREAVTTLLDLTGGAEERRGPDAPICSGGPTRTWLESLVPLGDADLAQRLRAFRSTAYAPEAHRLTVAELAAVGGYSGG